MIFFFSDQKASAKLAAMVHHYGNDSYSFRLDHVDCSSANSTLSSIHKQRIDTLFRRRVASPSRQQLAAPKAKHPVTPSSSAARSSLSPSERSKHSVLIHNSESARASQQRKSPEGFSSTVSIKQTPSTIINVSSSKSTIPSKSSESAHSKEKLPSSGANASQRIQIHQHKELKPSAEAELEEAFGGKIERQKAFLNTRSAVQAQIERLFADATRENTIRNQRIDIPAPPPLPARSAEPPPPPSLKTHPAFRNSPSPSSPTSLNRNTPSPQPSGTNSNCSTVSRSSSPRSSNSSGSHSSNMVYRVDYLGAIELSGKATSLDVLQDPLKQLYYKHKYNVTRGCRIPLSTLSITDVGLRIVRNTSIREEVDFTNPFTTIAVWAAIKMVIKKKINNSGQVSYTYAFLPLICDPEAQEKFNTYHPLNVPDPTIMDSTHPPMFACVMRKIGESRLLECHGFICRSSEDAIVIAANLYQSLLGTMSHDSSSSASVDDSTGVMSDSELTPKPPPRKRRTPPSSAHGTLRRASSEDMLRTTASLEVCSNRLKRTTSDRHNIIAEETEPNQVSKLGLPRSKSFANMPQIVEAQNLFGDPKKKIGLGSIDEVLKAVINPNGMSYTEMDPQHRELLMKMALILTKDEIYKRSKNIMRSQRPRSSSLLSGFESDSDASTIASVLRATKKSITRLGSRASNSLRPSYLKERMPLKKFSTQGGYLGSPQDLKETSLKMVDYNPIVDGSLTRSKAPKTPLPKRNGYHSGYSTYSECDNDSECSSKCYCTLPLHSSQQKKADGLNRQAGGKKKGACDCESESCAESERCYCSLKRVKKNGLKMYEINLDSETDTTVTTSTVRRNRSKSSSRYGSQSNINEYKTNSWNRENGRKSPSFIEQSRSRSAGTVFSSKGDLRQTNSLSPRAPNHVTRSSTKSRRSNSRTRAQSTDSVLESRRYRRPSGSLGSNGSDSSRSSPGLDSNHSDSSRGSGSSSSEPKILLLSAVDPSGKVVYRGASQKRRREGSDTILSIKKTAEIAALFSELKLDQKTDLISKLQEQVQVLDTDTEHYETMQDQQSFMFSDNIENSLGYLP